MPVKRVRDKLRMFKPQEVVSYEDWQDILSRWSFASAFLDEKNPASQILKEDLRQAREIIIHNRVHEVREVRIIGEIQKIFTTDKQSQMDELVGQIKYIEDYMTELQSWIDRKTGLEHLEAEGKVVIRREPLEEPING